MRKAGISVMLFLILCISVNAQQYKVVKQVVGSGGFVNQTSGQNKMSGIWGQSFVGVINPTVDSKSTKMFIGFWSPNISSGTSVNEIPTVTRNNIFNYPNPVENATSFRFNLTESSFVTLRIYNSVGSLLTVVADNQLLPEGSNSIEWTVSNIPSNELAVGAYFYELSVVPAFANAAKNSYVLRNSMLISK